MKLLSEMAGAFSIEIFLYLSVKNPPYNQLLVLRNRSGGDVGACLVCNIWLYFGNIAKLYKT